jgi:hypothetical protein
MNHAVSFVVFFSVLFSSPLFSQSSPRKKSLTMEIAKDAKKLLGPKPEGAEKKLYLVLVRASLETVKTKVRVFVLFLLAFYLHQSLCSLPRLLALSNRKDMNSYQQTVTVVF